MSEQIEWIPLPVIVRMNVSTPQRITPIPMIAWRWNHENRDIEYLALDGFIFRGKYRHEVGVTGLSE